MTDWNFIKCVEFIRYDEAGNLLEIMCKVCGSAIAGFTSEVSDQRFDANGIMVKTVREKFLRYHNYGEIKIQFTNGSFHVTTGCTKCISEHLTPEQLQEMYDSDVIREPTSYTVRDRTRKADRVAAVMMGAGGLA